MLGLPLHATMLPNPQPRRKTLGRHYIRFFPSPAWTPSPLLTRSR
jgi:hypothetical protein